MPVSKGSWRIRKMYLWKIWWQKRLLYHYIQPINSLYNTIVYRYIWHVRFSADIHAIYYTVHHINFLCQFSSKIWWYKAVTIMLCIMIEERSSLNFLFLLIYLKKYFYFSVNSTAVHCFDDIIYIIVGRDFGNSHDQKKIYEIIRI